MMKPDTHLKGYLKRWYLIPKNRWFNVYLHCFEGSDNDRAAHDHPWWSVSFLLKGKLTEEIQHHSEGAHFYGTQYRAIRRFIPYFRDKFHSHIMRLESKTAWTLFITGPVKRQWGFWTREYSEQRVYEDGYKYYDIDRLSHWKSKQEFLYEGHD